MKHIRHSTRPQYAWLDVIFFSWCEPYVADGFCYSIECSGGMFGIRRTGGFAGVNEFFPIFPCGKGG